MAFNTTIAWALESVSSRKYQRMKRVAQAFLFHCEAKFWYDDAEFYKADLRRRGYVIHSLTDQIPDGPFGRVIESITPWKDEERLREISKDAQRGLQWLAQQGFSVGGFPP
jgi:hypothetical protein